VNQARKLKQIIWEDVMLFTRSILAFWFLLIGACAQAPISLKKQGLYR
jgi:hypothetical protein